MARITTSDIGNTMLPKLPRGFKENKYRKYFFDQTCIEGNYVLYVTFKSKYYTNHYDFHIGIIYDSDNDASDDLKVILDDVNVLKNIDVSFCRLHSRLMKDYKYYEYEITMRAYKNLRKYLDKYVPINFDEIKVENFTVHTKSEIPYFVQIFEYPFEQDSNL